MVVGQGCAKPDAKEEKITGTTQENVDEITQGISDIEGLDEEINVSDLDSLGNEIDDINW